MAVVGLPVLALDCEDADPLLYQGRRHVVLRGEGTTVSDFASNFDTAFFGTASFIGDYNGLAVHSVTGKACPVWTGNAPGSLDSDIFFKIVNP